MASSTKKIFFEIKLEIYKVIFLETFLAAAVVFFGLSLILALLKISQVYALVVGIIFLIFNIFFRMKQNLLRQLEEKNPHVSELLRTAHDTGDDDSIMVKSLLHELQEKLPTISSGNMLSYGKVASRLAIIMVVSFAGIFLSAHNVHLLKLDALNDVDSIKELLSGNPNAITITSGGGAAVDGTAELDGVEFNNSDGIFGAKKLAVLGEEELELQINPSLSEIDLDNLAEEEDLSFLNDVSQFDIVAKGTTKGTYKDPGDPEETQIAKEYNMKIQAAGKK